MAIPIGIAQGLSYRHDFEKDMERVYQNAAYAEKIKAQKEQRTQFYANLLKKGHAVSPALTKKLEGFYSDLNDKLAQFVIDNPDFETDIGKMQEFISITDNYLNNDIIRTDLQSQQNYAKMQDAMSNGKMTKSMIEREGEKYQKYLETGEQYVFDGAPPVSLNDITAFIAKNIGYEDVTQQIGNHIYRIKQPKPGSIRKNVKEAYLSNEEYQEVINNAWNELGDWKNLYNSPLEMVESLVENKSDYTKLDQGLTAETSAAIKNAANYDDFINFQDSLHSQLITKGRTSSNPTNLIFGTAGGLNRQLPIGPSGSNFMIVDFDDKAQDYSPTGKNIRLSGKVTVTGGGELVALPNGETAIIETVAINPVMTRNLRVTRENEIQKFNGKEWIDVAYTDLNPEEQGYIELENGNFKLATDSEYAARLEESGFKKVKRQIRGFDSMGRSYTEVADVYVGTIAEKAEFTEDKFVLYNKAMGGTGEKVSNTYSTGQYKRAEQQFNQMRYTILLKDLEEKSGMQIIPRDENNNMMNLNWERTTYTDVKGNDHPAVKTEINNKTYYWLEDLNGFVKPE